MGQAMLTPDQILAVNFSEDFVARMRNRCIQGYFKYGPGPANVARLDPPATIRERLRAFELTGNTEFLVDAANICMFGYMNPSGAHPNGHFRATSTEESPRVHWTGDEGRGPGRS